MVVAVGREGGGRGRPRGEEGGAGQNLRAPVRGTAGRETGGVAGCFSGYGVVVTGVFLHSSAAQLGRPRYLPGDSGAAYQTVD